MAIEAKRGCGYRKVGGIYLVSSGLGVPCDRLPFPLTVCPTCSAGIKQTRGWTWVDLAALTGGPHDLCQDDPGCVMCAGVVTKAGLLWIGERFYRTPLDFQTEAVAMGVSRRISTVPHGFKVGESWVLLAHPRGIPARLEGPPLPKEWHENTLVPMTSIEPEEIPAAPGIFRAFRPERIEVLVTDSQSKDDEYMAKLAKRGLTPVIVPDNDKDHQGTVYDADDESEPLAFEESPLAGLVQ